ncbi:MAG TPA: hypothetical protein VGJ67_02835 [Actinomycetota bacterium]
MAVFLPVVATLASRTSTVDLAYHVRAGLAMLATHTLPRVDTYTFTAAGRSWLDQQWGAQLLFAIAFRAGAWPALLILQAALVGVIFFLVYTSCRAAGATMRRAAVLTIASFLVAFPGLSLRPQLFAMVLFALTLRIVVRRHLSPRWLFAVPVIVAVWANLHGSFFLAPILLGLAWLEDRGRSPETARRLLWVAVLSLLASLANPFGFRIWTYVIGISRDPTITRFVSEWQPPTIRTYGGAAFFISVAVVAVLLARRAESTPWPALISLGIFFAIALDAQRGIMWWAFLVPVVLSGLLDPGRPVPSSERRLLNTAIAIGLVIAVVAFAPWWKPTDAAGLPSGTFTDAPAGITRALSTLVHPGDHLLDAQLWGSWFEFRYPGARMAVDSRIELFPAGVWSEYGAVSAGRQGWQRQLDAWHVNLVVASREQQRELIPLIAADPSWRVVYSDADGAIYARSPDATSPPA